MVLTSILAASLALVQQPPASEPSAKIYSRTVPIGQTTFVQGGKKVSLHYNEASLKDVLNGLKKEKIDFVVDADSFKDRRITLNLNDVPLSTALNAIADALDAHWETVGTVRVLKKGAGFGAGASGLFGNGQFRTFTMPKEFEKGFFDGKAFEEATKAMGEVQKQLKGQKFEFKQMEGFQSKAFEDARRSLEQARAGGAYKSLSPKDSEEFRKAMERIRGGGSGKTFEPFRMDETNRKALEGMQKEMLKNRIELRGLMNDEMRKSMEKAKLDGKLQGEEMRKVLEKARGAVNLDGKGLDSLLKSITPEQKELAKKQGFLKVSDLTPEQKKLAGIKDGGTIEITIIRDGETLKIKGE